MNKMTDRIIRHGEAVLINIAGMPSGAIGTESRELIVAHSETGHHHVAVGEVTSYTGFDVTAIRKQLTEICYGHAEVTGLFRAQNARLEHRKAFDQHATVTIPDGLWVITIKQQYDPFEKLIARTRD
jgi:hypothetical protein